MKTKITKFPVLASFLAIVIISIATLFSCGGNDVVKPATYVKENPLQAYFIETKFAEVSSVVDEGDYEFGISFMPRYDGEISAIVVKLPAEQTNLRMTLWDAVTKTVIETDTLVTVAAETETSKPIKPLAVTKNHEYMITFNTNDWYEHVRADGSDVTYPIIAGDISITGYGYSQGIEQLYPTEFETSYYAGDLSFVFQRNK
jgi:hypothetical protein